MTHHTFTLTPNAKSPRTERYAMRTHIMRPEGKVDTTAATYLDSWPAVTAYMCRVDSEAILFHMSIGSAVWWSPTTNGIFIAHTLRR